MATTWGKVLDQASIISSAFRELEKACIKATRHDNTIPKEKHVRRLILCTHERGDLTEEIYNHLARRMELPDWIVVLKTLVVFHRLFRDGNPRFVGDLKWKGTIFPLSRFNDPTSGEAHVQSVFIRKYALYLEEKVMVFRALRMEFEKDPGLLKGLSIEDSFVRLPKLQRQLDALINCQTSAEAITNPITSLAFEMLLKDSFKLYRGLNDAVITLLESFFSLDKNLAIQALEIYRGFMRETSAIIAMYEMAKKKFTLELPDLKHAPTTLVNSMEDYIRDLDDGGNRTEQAAAARAAQAQVAERGHGSRGGSGGSGGGRAPQPPSPKHVEAPNLIDAFDSEPVHVPPPQRGAPAPSFIDPFGVSAPVTQPQQQQLQFQPPANNANLFDPFGDSTPTPSPHQQAQSLRQPSSANFPSSGTDPFATAPTYNPFATPQVSYEEKAQHIKAAFAPPLQPTSPSITASAGPQYSYPKPNYNVSLNQQPQPQQPYATQAAGGQFGTPNPYATQPSPQPTASFNAASQFNLVAGPQQPFATNNNPFNAPPTAAGSPYGAQPQSSNPFF